MREYKRDISLIEDSEEEENRAKNEDQKKEKNKGHVDKSKEDYKITLIEKKNVKVEDKTIMGFINYCVEEGIFDDTFYDYGNAFSIIATKLPKSFDYLSDDGENIRKKRFIRGFKKKYRYGGNIEAIYESIDRQEKGYIDWEEYIDFFLPFCKYVTI